MENGFSPQESGIRVDFSDIRNGGFPDIQRGDSSESMFLTPGGVLKLN
jgi:hypothetical protein